MLGGRGRRAVAATTTTTVVALSGTAATTTTAGAAVPARAPARAPAPGPTPGGIGVTDLLGPPGEPLNEVGDINERGQVLGRVERPPVGWFPFSAAVLWQGGRSTLIDAPADPPPPLTGTLTVPAEISDRGVISGDRVHVSGFARWPFTWSGGTFTALDPPEAVVPGLSGTAPAVNRQGQVLSGRQQAVAEPDDPFDIRLDAGLAVWEGGRQVASSDAEALPVDLNVAGTVGRVLVIWTAGRAVPGAGETMASVAP